MKRVTMVRYTLKPGMNDENARLSRAVFDRLRADAPDDISYATFRDGDEWLHLMVNFAGDNSDAVTATPEFDAFQAEISARCAVSPQPVRLTMEPVERYGFA